jgi:hypothetical protein
LARILFNYLVRLHRNWKCEWRIHRVLRGLARQRVAMVAKPSNVWVIELALQISDDVDADLQTCLMRGWVEVLHNDMPSGDLDDNYLLEPGPLFTETKTLYRLTEGGWAARNRAHAWTLTSTLIAIVALIASFIVT